MFLRNVFHVIVRSFPNDYYFHLNWVRFVLHPASDGIHLSSRSCSGNYDRILMCADLGKMMLQSPFIGFMIWNQSARAANTKLRPHITSKAAVKCGSKV